MLKSLVAGLHRLINRSAVATSVYLRMWLLILRGLPSSRLKDRVVANLGLFGWQHERLPALTTGLRGTAERVWLVPHPGMMDFQLATDPCFAYEPEVVGFLDSHLADVDTVIEIGANVGVYTVWFARKLAARPQTRVFAFEPGVRTFRALLDNLAANRVANVSPFNVAVFSHSGIETFYEPLVAAHGYRNLARSSLVESHARWDAAEVRTYPVLTVGPEVLELLLKDRGRVLIKLDIEGAEKHVLKALRPLLERYRPAIVMEVLHNEAAALNELEFLQPLYRFLHLTDDGPVEHRRSGLPAQGLFPVAEAWTVGTGSLSGTKRTL